MKKNDELFVEIRDVGINMEGIAHADGQTLFVPYTLPGERVKVRVINTKSKNFICKAMNIDLASVDRVEPICPYFGKCGGCDCMHIAYDKQLEYKHGVVKKTLSKMLGDVSVNECVSSPNYRYRNKMSLPIVSDGKDTVIGMYRVASHKIIGLKDCVIAKGFVAKLIDATGEFIKKYHLKGYNEENGTGLLRHIVARSVDDQLLITLVATKLDVPHIDKFVDILAKRFDKFNLSVNLNDSKTNVIFGKEFKTIYGNSYVETSSHGITYPISAYSFMQVNDYMRDKIYDYVLSCVESSDNVVDAYSGAGLLTAMLSKKCRNCYGIEIIDSAVADANNLIKANGIDNVQNILGDCSVELPKLMQTLHGLTTLVLDPPRKGCSEVVLNSILGSKNIGKIIYISCNPATLARDLKMLSAKYEIVSIQPFDMFPNTKHIETVVELKGKSNE